MESIPATKLCYRCKEEKPTSEFYRSTERGLQRECKACTRSRRRKWWASPAGKESSRRTKLKARFRITPEEYRRMLEAQNGVCAICKSECASGHRLSVDHCHKSNRVRSLLCKSCNVALGNLGDSPERCEQAAAYLRQHSTNL